MKNVKRFAKEKGKLNPRFVVPYEILKRVGKVAYELDLPNVLAPVHPVFHVSMLEKRDGDLTSLMSLEGLRVVESLSYEEVSVDILDRQIKKLRKQGSFFRKRVMEISFSGGCYLGGRGRYDVPLSSSFPSTPILARDLEKGLKGEIWASPLIQNGPWTLHNILDGPCRGPRSFKDVMSDHPGLPWEGSPRQRPRRPVMPWTTNLGVRKSHQSMKPYQAGQHDDLLDGPSSLRLPVKSLLKVTSLVLSEVAPPSPLCLGGP
ncbi:hypothetical protein MTR67_043020 [Solanum verrucosum]|uniref:Tf2-1-like SH3-like domain-containing protein n=1 Tax=Solanum verrucosum TaxID=315347 RepID=A0AAF0UPI9_SOLVR|nr:hypothetical protein MTR67_043020 [Solanum verrucosum]